ncbi:ABC transporter permease [Streptococcus panodentis]|uniref:ABC transporter permease n=1 Tax=Streptococcus panodentis TaxID=1581472 RepID=A0ABS5AW00_9STRE|nr:ABC transporter permease [Streptococcus panodentis]MBP2620655.1 ABC transporter permease [Streptococcus panodentis]
MAFFYFELKRFLNSPKNKICLVLLAAIFLGLFAFYQTTINKQSFDSNLTFIREQLQQSKQSVKNLQNQAQLDPDDQTISQQLIQEQEKEKLLSEELAALEKKDLKKAFQLEYQDALVQLEAMTDKNSDSYQNLKACIRYREAVKAVGGIPGFRVNSTSEAAFNIGHIMTGWLSSTTIFVLLTVLIADSLSSEIESSQIRFYQLLGGRKLKHLLIKLLVPVLVTFLFTLLLFAVLYLAKGLLDSFGTWSYPYLLGRTIVPIWQIVLQTLALFLVALLFLASLGQLLALIFKKSLVVIGLIIVFLTGFLTLAQEEWFQPLKQFFPFEYLGYGQLLNDAAVLPNNAFLIGIFYLLSLSLIFTLASYQLYKNFYYRKEGKA